MPDVFTVFLNIDDDDDEKKKELLSSFRMNGHTLGFMTQKSTQNSSFAQGSR